MRAEPIATAGAASCPGSPACAAAGSVPTKTIAKVATPAPCILIFIEHLKGSFEFTWTSLRRLKPLEGIDLRWD